MFSDRHRRTINVAISIACSIAFFLTPSGLCATTEVVSQPPQPLEAQALTGSKPIAPGLDGTSICSRPVQGRSYDYSLKAGNHKRKLKMPGGKRSYVVHVPKSYALKKQPVPVVFVLHGGLGNAWSAEWDSQMSARAEKDNFLAVYPQGTGRTNEHFLTWNAGDCCGIAMRHKVDDITFLRALIYKLSNDFNVDRSRIYVAGISNGGMMAYRAALEMSDMIAAIAPVEGCMMSKPQLTSDRPVSVIAFHGTADKTVPYNGGDGGIPGYKLVATKVDDNIKYWVERNGCSPEPSREVGKSLTKEFYKDGKDGTAVCLYTVKDGLHSWPGGRSTTLWINLPATCISATDAMCEFFWEHPKLANDDCMISLSKNACSQTNGTPPARNTK